MLFRQLFDEDTWTYTYLLADPETKEALIIDPVLERADRDARLISELGLELVYSLDTHVHADHVTGSGAMRETFGAQTVLSKAAGVDCADITLDDGDTLRFGSYEIEARQTPGHTGGDLTYVVRDGERTLAFTGDALLVRGCGRTDFQQGDARRLFRSVRDRIFSLPDDALVYPGHDYRGRTVTTVGEEKALNPRLRLEVTEEQFVEIMDNLGLADPKRMHVAVPANLACGNGKKLTFPRDVPI